MRSFISAMVIAASFGLLVPDNQSLRAAESFRALPEAAYSTISLPAAVSHPVSPAAPGVDLSWVLALGFLVAIVSRRLGSES